MLDGNYDRTRSIKWSRATLVIWLDYSLPLAFSRVVRRTIRRSITRNELWPGTNNRESFAKMFSPSSVVLWTLTQHARQRRRNAAAMHTDEWSHLQFVRLRSPKAAQNYLAEIAKRQTGMW